MPAVIKLSYLDKNPGKAFFMQHDKIQGAQFSASKETFTLPEKKKTKLFTPYLGMTLWEITVSALLDLDTESSTYQA